MSPRASYIRCNPYLSSGGEPMRYKWAVVNTLLAAALITTGTAAAASSDLTPVPAATPKTPGFAAPNILSPDLTEIIAAQGSMRLENGAALTNFYGYDN